MESPQLITFWISLRPCQWLICLENFIDVIIKFENFVFAMDFPKDTSEEEG